MPDLRRLRMFLTMGHATLQATTDALPERSVPHVESGAAFEDPAPLVVDLDGTLTPGDTLYESMVHAIKHKPSVLLSLPLWLLRGKAELKARLAEASGYSADTLPLRGAFLAYLRDEQARGRRIILATAAHRSIAESVARRTGLFDEVLATEGATNLKGETKLAAIRKQVGTRFAYAGDSTADLGIWHASAGAIVVGSPRGINSVRKEGRIEREFDREPAGPLVWMKALRVHQWTKNLLIFVPLLTSFSLFNISSVVAAVLAFAAFSCAASATYLINDLLDLESDRSHPRKCERPLAACRIGIPQALAAAAGLMVVAAVLALAVGPAFALLLGTYVVLTSAYTWLLKHYVLMDVLMLATLYTLRIAAGSVAIGVTLSSWLLAFSVFMFLSLALVKRCSELVALQQVSRRKTSGRDYNVQDLVVLWPMGVGAGLCSVVVFGLFISTPEMQSRYGTPELMWLVGIALLYWLGRLWIKTSRGEMHDDPIVFALRDYGSRVTIAASIAFTIAAHAFRLP